jgi:uncharacterized protein YraI
MYKSKTVTVDLFVSMVEQIASESPTYQLGHDGSDGKCDCIGLVRGALKRAGANPTNLRGTNQAARKAIRNLHRIKKVADLKLGQVVLKVRDADDPDYPLPDKYRKGGSAYNGDLTNYTHIGTVTRVSPLRITHMTSPTAQRDSRLGKWIYAGDLPWVSNVQEANMTAAKVYAPNGKPVNFRRSPGGALIGKVPVGTQVEVIESGPVWSTIQYGDQQGYMMTEFLATDQGQEQQPNESINLVLTRPQAEALVQIADVITAMIGRG